MHVVFYLGPSFEKWDPESIEKHGSGASEWMAVEIAKHLAKRGHEVLVYADTPKRGTFDGVVYVPQGEFGAGPVTDVLVAYRRPEVLDLSCLGRTDRLVFVTTDKHHDAMSDAQVAMTQRFVVVSEWHKRRFQLVHKNVPDRKLVVIPNGVRRTWTGQGRAFRKTPLIHTSAPDRGLEHAIRAMPAIMERAPDAMLHVYADFSVPLAHARQSQNAERVDRLQKLEFEVRNTPGVVFHGRVGRRELVPALADARVGVYTATVEETSCVSAMEAQALGCRVVATRLVALEDTCAGPACELVEPPWVSWPDQYVAAVVRALENPAPVPAVPGDTFSLDKALEAYEEVITGQAPRLVSVPAPAFGQFAKGGEGGGGGAAIGYGAQGGHGGPGGQTIILGSASAEDIVPAALPVLEARKRADELFARVFDAKDKESDPDLVLDLANAYLEGALITKAHEMFRWLARMKNASENMRYEAALQEARLLEKLTDKQDAIQAAYEFANEVQAAHGLAVGLASIEAMDVMYVGDWKLVLPKSETARSLEDFRRPIAEALLAVAGRDGVPAGGEVWFGVHEDGTPEPPPGAMIFQSEVFSSPWFSQKYRERLARAAEVWDYSTANQPHYEARLKRHVPIRWSQCEVRPPTFDAPPIELGLIGSMCQRRAELRPELKIFDNVSGRDRLLIERGIKVHVVPHFYEGAPVEQARISGLLASGYCVVAEEAPDQADYPGPVYVPHQDLMQVARGFLESDIWRVQGLEGQRRFRATSMVESLVAAYKRPLPLGSFGGAVSPLRLNLGACDEQSRVAGYVSVDIAKGADVVADLTKAWPWETSTVDEVLAIDLIEHLPDKIFTMNEAFRVLKPGGILKITVPTTDGRGAWQDPTHISFWNRNSFWYFTDGDAHRERFGERYGIEARFRVKHEIRRESGEGIAFLEITLEAVKKPYLDALGLNALVEQAQHNLIAASLAVSARPVSISEAGSPAFWAGFIPQKFVAMLRVKNEARWIGQVLDALRTVTDETHVLDDHSTDDTRAIAQRKGAHVYASPFQGLDETRDKNLLFDMIKALHAEDLREDTRLWVIGIDGDEELEPGAVEILRDCTDPRQLAYSFQVLYLWDREDQVRVDGVYGNFRRMSMFRPVSPELRFEGTPMHGNLHCKSIPEKLIASGKEHRLKLLHYGYLERNDRVAKYLRYNELDPGNIAEDQYRHIVQGDGFVREAMRAPGILQANVPAAEKLKWAGPLTLAPLATVLGKKPGE